MLPRGKVTAGRLRRFLAELAKIAKGETRVYLTEGATAVLYGWRESTIDVDMRMAPGALAKISRGIGHDAGDVRALESFLESLSEAGA